LVGVALIDGNLGGESGLARLTFAQQCKPLAAYDRKQRINRHHSGFQLSLQHLTGVNGRRVIKDAAGAVGGNRAVAVQRVAHYRYHSADEILANLCQQLRMLDYYHGSKPYRMEAKVQDKYLIFQNTVYESFGAVF